MCGIFGAIGEGFNRGIIRALTLVNRERGQESLGYFDSAGRIAKKAGDPLDLLAECCEFIDASDRWFIAGHTRYATYGKRTNKNAHPFKFGRIIGTHNGCVDFPYRRNYSVDSQYLFDELNRADGNYQTAFGQISGYWGLAWFDGESFWLQAHDNKVSIGKAPDGVWYYSSDRAHLSAAAGSLTDVLTLENGATIRFSAGNPSYDVMPVFVSAARGYVRKRWNYSTPLASSRLDDDYYVIGEETGATVKGLPKGYVSLPHPNHVAAQAAAEASQETPPKGTPTRAWLEDRIMENIEFDDIDYADDLAQGLGYGGLVDFMQAEGMNDVHRALTYLEDASSVKWKADFGGAGDDEKDFYDRYDNRTDGRDDDEYLVRVGYH